MSDVCMSPIQRRILRSTSGAESPSRIAIWVVLVAVLAYFAAKLGGTVAMRPQVDWPLWPGNVVLVSILLMVPRRIWPILMAAAFAAFALYDLQFGVTIRSIALLILSDLVEVLIAACGLHYAFGGIPRLDSVRTLAKYAFWAVILAPFAAAFVGAAASSGNYWSSWRISFVSEALAFLTLAPAIFGWVSKGTSKTREALAYHLEGAALFVGLLVLGYLTFVSPWGIIEPALPVVPFLLWAALRFGSTGVSTAMVVLAALSIWGAINGRGPVAEMGPLRSVISLQVFLLFAAAPFMVLAALVEERKQAEEARFKHAAIVESSEDAIISQNLEGTITSWNAGAQRIFGYAEEEVVGQSANILIPRELLEDDRSVQQRLIRGERIEHYETVRVRKDERPVNVSLTISAVRNSAGKVVGSSRIARDITEQQRAEQSLLESENRFRLVANTAPVMIWTSGLDKLCDYFNQTWLKFTGRSLVSELGNGWAEGVYLEDVRECMSTYTRAFNARQPFEMEYRLRRHDGAYRWICVVAVPRFNENGSFAGYIGSCTDITDRKLAEEVLSTVGRRLIEAHEEERSRIARELHDDINQRLALLANGLQEYEQVTSTGNDWSQKKELHELWQLTNDIATDIQHISHQLHPAKLHYLGLASAVRDLCHEFSRQHKVEVDCVVRELPPELEEGISLSLFRTVQESLRNVVKHSRARHVKVEMTHQSSVIELTISDDGIGFDPELARSSHGLGLVSMRERLRSVSGELSIWSKPSLGTQVKGTVPDTARGIRDHKREDSPAGQGNQVGGTSILTVDKAADAA
ncbi:MAG: PAS domain S-box protein [Candidatus Sulfotelmatobacter sp.]